MRYAESLLLCGQLIDAEEANFNTYEDLLCVCPHSKKKVMLGQEIKSTMEEIPALSTKHIWTHCENISAIALEECREKNRYIEGQIDTINDQARQKRLELFQPHLWELIKSASIFKKPVTFENYDNVWKYDLIRWFAEDLEEMCEIHSFRVRAKESCEVIYSQYMEMCGQIGEVHVLPKLHKIFLNDGHIFYRQQIAGEILQSVLQDFEKDYLRKLIYLGIFPEIYEEMHKFYSKFSQLVAKLLEGKDFSDFMQLGDKNRYECMNFVQKTLLARLEFIKEYSLGLAEIHSLFVYSLTLIFSSIPWIDELKKLNTHTPTS